MLTVQDLAYGRGGLRLIDGLSFSVEPGQALILRGPNGAGKTTLLRVLAGLQTPDAGEVKVERDDIAYGGHAEGNKPTLTVAENLNFWASIYGTPVDPDVIETFTLGGLEDRLAGRLSAGQRRRLGLARLAVSGRLLLLLDEPTTSLDAASVALFGSWLERHLQAGGAAVVVAHGEVPVTGPEIDLADFTAALPEDAGW